MRYEESQKASGPDLNGRVLELNRKIDEIEQAYLAAARREASEFILECDLNARLLELKQKVDEIEQTYLAAARREASEFILERRIIQMEFRRRLI